MPEGEGLTFATKEMIFKKLITIVNDTTNQKHQNNV